MSEVSDGCTVAGMRYLIALAVLVVALAVAVLETVREDMARADVDL